MNLSRGHHGFTLVELIAALSVTVLVVGSTGVILRTISAARKRADLQMAAQHEARTALNAIVTAISNAHRPPVGKQPLLEGSDDWLGDAPADRIRFFTISHRLIRHEQPESDVRQVEFALMEPEDDEAIGLMLMRRTDPTLNDEPDVGGVIERIADNVVGFDVQYHDGVEWFDDWPETQRGWPTAVRVRLTVVADPELGRTWSVGRLVSFPYWPRGGQGGD